MTPSPHMCDLLNRLDVWKQKHKARTVRISNGSGFMAPMWLIELRGEQGKRVCAHSATSAARADAPPSVSLKTDNDGVEHVRAHGAGGAWGTLEQTLTAALDRWASLYGE